MEVYLVGLALIFVPLWPGPDLLNIFSMDNIHTVVWGNLIFYSDWGLIHSQWFP